MIYETLDLGHVVPPKIPVLTRNILTGHLAFDGLASLLKSCKQAVQSPQNVQISRTQLFTLNERI